VASASAVSHPSAKKNVAATGSVIPIVFNTPESEYDPFALGFPSPFGGDSNVMGWRGRVVSPFVSCGTLDSSLANDCESLREIVSALARKRDTLRSVNEG
jgi:hypothetical protein